MKAFQEASRRTTRPATKVLRSHTITPRRHRLLSDSAQDLHAWSSARPPHRVNYRSDIIDGGQRMGLRKPKSIKHNGKSLADILEAHERLSVVLDAFRFSESHT